MTQVMTCSSQPFCLPTGSQFLALGGVRDEAKITLPAQALRKAGRMDLVLLCEHLPRLLEFRVLIGLRQGISSLTPRGTPGANYFYWQCAAAHRVHRTGPQISKAYVQVTRGQYFQKT